MKTKFLNLFCLVILSLELHAQILFWDQPRILSQNASFPQAHHLGRISAIIWQERIPLDENWSNYSISLMIKDGSNQQEIIRQQVLGPFRLTGEDAPIFSFILGPNSILWLAVQVEPQQVVVYQSRNLGESFSPVYTIKGRGNLTNPRISLAQNNLPVLVMTEVLERRYRILFSKAVRADQWTEPYEISQNQVRNLNFNPSVSVLGNRIDVVFQSLVSTLDLLSYQLFLVTSLDGGTSWQPEINITNFSDDTQDPLRFQNDRPFLQRYKGQLWLSWERTPRGQSKRAMVMRLNDQGQRVGEPWVLSQAEVVAEAVRLFEIDGFLHALWFDNRRGERSLNVSRFENESWLIQSLSLPPGASLFGSLIPSVRGFTVVGQNIQGNRSTVFLVEPDLQVRPPSLVAQNFDPTKRFRPGEFNVRLGFPADPSGISGYNFEISKSPTPNLDQILSRPVTQPEIRIRADTEGTWYVHAIIRDGAGNWSKPTSLNFQIDTTPPAPVTINQPELDDEGFLPANTFEITWTPNDVDVVSYTYRLQFLNARTDFDAQSVVLASPPPQPLTTNPFAQFNNLENGLWALSVAAIDEAGNIGEPQTIILALRRFIIYTRIDRVIGTQDEFGAVQIRILGRGFLGGGRISRLWIEHTDRDRLEIAAQNYQVISDREIVINPLVDLKQGFYRVGFQHSLRGVFQSGLSIFVDEKGNVKIGDYSPIEWRWIPIGFSRWIFSVGALPMLGLLSLLAALVLLFSLRTFSLINDQLVLRRWYQIFQNRGVVMDKISLTTKQKVQGLGLQLKFTISILSLAILIILMLSISLGFFITENSQRNLGSGLLQRTTVLLDSLATNAKNTLPDEFVRDLALIPSQRLAMSDALSVTITGRKRGGGGGTQFVWASDDPNLSNYIEGSFIPGESLIQDDATEAMNEMEQRLNNLGAQELGGLNARLAELNAQSQALLFRQDAEAERIRQLLGDELERVNQQIQEALRRLGQEIESIPRFDPTELSEDTPTYLFFKPVLYIIPGEKSYVQGFVRLRVSVESILEDIKSAREQLIQLTGLIALAAMALGLLGSFLLSVITVRPINTLVKAVEKIRDTEDKEKLKGFSVNIKTGDELAVLADTINEMTEGLVKAAIANKDLTLGKEIQKMFIPLITDPNGRKMTTGKLIDPMVEFFGYYEGAKGVSGDYFDFTKLDNHHYAIIKCDVAGKGVPAALIMVEVATIFLNYFRDWKEGSRLTLPPLAARINTLLEERGFKGRFAALTIALYQTKTGTLRLCNAGDTVINIYSAQEKRVLVKELPRAPAAGVFSTDLVEMQGGFKEISINLKEGDTVFFYTDGVEESKRIYRNAEFQPITIPAPQGEGEISDEELGPERIHGIIEAVFNQGIFSLDLPYSPWQGRLLEFDFTTCEPTAQNAVLAIVSVEKIWRLIVNPAYTSHEKVKFDRNIYQFLRAHFKLFDEVFRFDPTDDELPEYAWLGGLQEDDQYDDLTLVALRRKA